MFEAEPEAEGLLNVVAHGLAKCAYDITVTRQDGSTDVRRRTFDLDVKEGQVFAEDRITVTEIVERADPDSGKVGKANAKPTTSRPAY